MNLFPLTEYDFIIVSFSGGKDSQACVAKLLADGAPRDKIELWHQHVDGDKPGSLMDWPCTPAYCQAYADEMGMELHHQWKDGGFEGEMNRQDQQTQGAYMHDGQGDQKYLPPSSRGKKSTRRLFPQVTANLQTRWCSAYLKIDVAARAIANDPRLTTATILYVTGERREESAARAKYKTHEPHRTSGTRRRVDHYRPVLDWTESQVWNAIETTGIVPHPAYRLGWSRLSCVACIFGQADQWASLNHIAPSMVAKIAEYEDQFGKTIHRTLSVQEQVGRGRVYPATKAAPVSLLAQAMATTYTDAIAAADWTLPAGAFGRSAGPS